MKQHAHTVCHLEAYVYAVLPGFTKCFHSVIVRATIPGVLATGQAPGTLHILYLLHVYLIYGDFYDPHDYYLLSVSLLELHTVQKVKIYSLLCSQQCLAYRCSVGH